jgi:hypothetical protein
LHTGRRIQTRRSGVHGKGVFALCRTSPRGEVLVEYTGEVIGWQEAQRPPPARPQCNPTTRFTSMWMKTA